MAGFRGKVSRAIFSAEDPRTIRAAFDDLRPAGEFDGQRRAGEARRQADQIVNLTLTRTATCTMLAKGRGVVGVGRVRSPTLAIVCMREAEIDDFTPRIRYAVVAKMAAPGGGSFVAECRKAPGTDDPMEDGECAAAIARPGNSIRDGGRSAGNRLAREHRRAIQGRGWRIQASGSLSRRTGCTERSMA